MRQSRANVEDSNLDVERRRTFRGSARISLDVLYFQPQKHRNLERKHVEYLKSCFRKDMCRRLEVQNHIDAEIDAHMLNAALEASAVSAEELLTNQPNGCPQLQFPKNFQLTCLHGQHRIQAAREFLLPTDKWWTVDLYTTDINVNLKTCINERHTNEDRPDDGELYYKIRSYHFQRDITSEMRWKTRLRGSRLKNYNELLQDEKLTAAFDALLDIPGIWGGMRLTTLQKMMAMGAKDEILNYLGRIKQIFLDLVGGDQRALLKLDRATIVALERRAPGASSADAQFLHHKLRGGEIFGAFSDRDRERIWARLRMVDGLVPSLFTFFRDIQYLKLCLDCLKRLAFVPKRGSIYETIQAKYTGVNQIEGQVKIQVAPSTFIHQAGTSADSVELGTRQLVALAMRDYPEMPADPVIEDPVQRGSNKADPAALRRLAELAYELGFDSDQIKLLKQHPKSTVPQRHPQSQPILVTSGPGVAMAQRSGIPRRKGYEEARDCLYINHLHDTQECGASLNRGATNGRPTGSPPASPISPTDYNVSAEPDRAESQGVQDQPDEEIDNIFSSYAQRNQGSHFRRSPSVGRERSDSPVEVFVSQASEEREREVERQHELGGQSDMATRGMEADNERAKRNAQERERAAAEAERIRKRQEQAAQKSLEVRRPKESGVTINFFIRERGSWRVMPSVTVDPGDPSEIDRIARKYARKGTRTLNTRLQMLSPQECYQAVINDRTHTILLVTEDEFNIDQDMVESASKLHDDARRRVLGLKRMAADDISESRHIQKKLAVS